VGAFFLPGEENLWSRLWGELRQPLRGCHFCGLRLWVFTTWLRPSRLCRAIFSTVRCATQVREQQKRADNAARAEEADFVK